MFGVSSYLVSVICKNCLNTVDFDVKGLLISSQSSLIRS
jgi:hypothetical protein